METPLQGLELRGDDELRHQPPEWEAELREIEEPFEAHEPWPATRTCSTRYRALHSSGRRRLSAIRWLVIHSTEGSTARGAAAWFANPRSAGSAHVVVDEIECYQTLPPSAVPWAAPGANFHGWHLELAGFASWSRARWRLHDRELWRAAYKLEIHAHRFGIPIRRLTAHELAAGVHGFTDHRTCTAVFGGTHTDPGAHFPWDTLLDRVHYYRRRRNA